MKKCRSALAFIALVVAGAFFANGAMVDEEVVRTVATGFLSKSSVARTILPGREVSSLEARGSLWLVRLAPSGYIELAGSTKCAPVLSFSENDFTEPEDDSPLAAKFASDSAWVAANEADEDATDSADWANYTAPAAKKRVLAAAAPSGTNSNGCDPFVAPILGATWNQTAPFNDLSPYNYFCGCMATAAGQELRYWRWPYRYEKFRQTTHGVRDAQFNYIDFVIRPNGLVPFNWDKVVASAPNPASTPWAADKEATYNTAWLSFWAQSLTGMGYKPGGSGGTKQLASTAEEYWYEKGRGMTYWADGYDDLWAAIKADLDWGSPIQINTAAHQMVIDGYAVENYGEEDEVDYINLNLGYGNATYWDNLRTAVTSGTYSGVLATFQTGFRPQKIVQFEPVPKVCTSDVTLTWHMAPCYTNRTTGFTIEIAKAGGAATSDTINTHDETTTYTATGLDVGGAYTFTVTPIMNENEGEGRANSVTTTIGEPKAAPEFLSVSSVACGIELLQQDIFIECAYGIVNKIDLTCSESTTEVVPYSSHLTILPDSQLSVTKNGNVFTVDVDATAMDHKWSGEMLVLTLVAKNEDGTEAYKNLMLRFNSMRQVINGTFDAAEGDSNSPVWFCGDTTIDAKGRAVSFGASAFQGTGKVTLIDSVGGGSFTFAGLDNFRGTLAFTGDCSVTLPEDMTKFEGTLSITSGTYTLSNDLSDSTKIIVAEGVTVTLDNANVASTITGAGTVNITSGSSVLSGAVTSSVKVFGGELTIPAGTGDYSTVAVGGGTLKIQLSKAQSILGYDWWLPLYTSGTVKFVLYDGTEVAATTTSATPGIKITLPSEANVWTGTDYATFGEYYSAKWANGLPNEGDYVIFKSELNDWMETGTTEGTMMALNLTSPRNLGYVLVKGTDKLEIGVYSGNTSALLSTDVLENEVETHITTTYFQPKTVIPRKTLSTSSGFILSCELDSAYAGNLKRHETGGSALTSSDYWRGTVVFCNKPANSLEIANYGNAQSKIRFNGVTGSLLGGQTFDGTLELVDYEGVPALNINSGSSSLDLTIGAVTGTGMFKTSGSETSLNILLKNIAGWTGSFDLASKTVAIGSAIPSSYTGKDGRLHIGQAATVAEDATWAAAGGLYLGAGGALTVNGAVETKNVTTYGAGASITLEDDAVLQVSTASVNDVAPTLNFKAGTFRVKEGSDAFRETSTINFCAGSGKRTVIDANGCTLTLGPNVFSGSGDVCLTSSKSGGKIVVEGISAAYTGTIYCDISCEVSLGDLSKTTCTIDVSDITVSRSSSDIGNLTIGSGATLEVTVSKAHIMSGLEIDSVTLVDGGTLVLRDKSGKELEYTTSDGKYILEGDSSVTAECLLDYEFNGNAASTGSDNSATLQASSTITYYDGSALYTKCTPWINKEFAMPDDEWTAVIRGTLPAANSERPTIVLMFGANGGNIFGLVAGTEENTVAIADRSGLIGSAVAVEDATTKYHVYTIVKTANRVRLYVDGVLKVDETKTISVPKKFQFGSVHGSNNSSYASCTGDESHIDYLKFYDFAVGENFDEMVYSGPKPIAVWDGDFSSSELTKFSGYELVDWNETHGENNSSVTIDNANQGLMFCSSTGLSGMTVLVRYSNLTAGTTNKRVLFTSTINSNYTGTRTGIRLASGSAGTLRGLWGNVDWNDSRNPESGSVDESGVMAFIYSKAGTVLYKGGSVEDLVEAWKCTNLKADADSDNSTIYGAGIGGYCASASADGYEAAQGMTITGVAVFDSALTASVLQDYRWPSETPEEPEITYEVSPEQGAVPAGTKMTVTCDDPTATIYYQKYGETEWSVYTEPVALSTGLNYYYVKVNDGKATLYTYMVAAPAVARIEGGDNYTSLQDAIDAASSDAENPSTITLLQSSEEEVTLSDKTIILDENGCTFGSLKGAGTLRMVGALPSETLKSLLQDASNWEGVFYLSGYTTKLSNFSFNWWGNINSTVRVDGINGYAGYVGKGGGTTYIAQIKELQIVGDGIEFNDAFGGHQVYIDAKITGDGKFAIKTKNSYTTASGGTRFIFTGDMDDYAGELDCSVDKDDGTDCSTVVILGKNGEGDPDSLPTASAKGQILVTANANVTLNNSWKTAGGVVINGAVTLGSSASITGAISLGAADATLTVPSGATAAEPTTSVENAYVKHVEDVYSVETYRTITFKNEDGSTLYTIANAKLGDTPVYVGDTPTKASTAQYDYTFDGVWDPAITTVTGDATYTAQFTPVLRSYEVTFDAGEHGSIAEGAKQMVAYGSTATPPEVTPAAGWSFTGWDGDTTAAITEVMTFTAQYAEKMTTTDYPVPYSWFIAHGIPEEWVSTVMKSKVSGSDYTWWEYYVLGLDPTNETSKFEVSIRMDGTKPIVEYSPTNTTLTLQYILQGKPTLTNEWQDVEFDEPGDTNRFFRVKVTW